MNDLMEDDSVKLSRRNVIIGTAWAVPVVMAVGATPAFAASNTVFAFTGLAPALINVANAGASITVSGTGPDNATVALTIGGTTVGTPTVVNGVWSAVIPAASLPQGTNVVVTATLSGTSLTRTYTKDTTAPAPTVTTFTYSPRAKTLTVGGAAGNATTPTADSATLTLTGGPVSPVTVTRTGATWSHVFTNVSNNVTYTLTVTQTDGAGNSGSGTLTRTT